MAEHVPPLSTRYDFALAHREIFRIVWWKKSRRKGNSRSKLDRETVKLVMDMPRSNRTWGAERIRGELLKLGVVVAKRTVQKYMRMSGYRGD